MPDAKILIVEDEGIEALDIQQRLINLGYPTPNIAFSGEEAIAKAKETTPDLVLVDIMLHGEMDGITAAKQIKACLEIPVIYLTAYSDEETLQRAKLTEPYGYIVKPFKERELYITINMALYRHEMERKLKESEQRFATTLRSIGDAVIAADAGGLITFMNPVAENLTGWKQAEAAHRHLSEVFKTVDIQSRQPVEDPATRVLREGTAAGLSNHTLLITRHGEEIPIDENAAPIKDDKEQRVTGVVLVFRDVTERKLAEEALRASEESYRALAEKLREADCRKNEFMAVLSHELRNPLAAICNSLSLLEQKSGSRAGRVWEIIERQIGQLTRLVDDLLDITRITQGKIQLQLQRLELNELVQKTVEDHRPLFEKKGVHLEVDIAP